MPSKKSSPSSSAPSAPSAVKKTGRPRRPGLIKISVTLSPAHIALAQEHGNGETSLGLRNLLDSINPQPPTRNPNLFVPAAVFAESIKETVNAFGATINPKSPTPPPPPPPRPAKKSRT